MKINKIKECPQKKTKRGKLDEMKWLKFKKKEETPKK